MNLSGIVRSGVALANSVTGSLQANITLYQWTGKDVYQKPTFAAGVVYGAIVEWKQERIRTTEEAIVTQVATVSILQPVAPNTATGRRNPIDPRDEVLLPSGQRCKIIPVEGLVDSGTSAAYYHVLRLG
jgi:hypothetical protein